jgi:hypothetical protein
MRGSVLLHLMKPAFSASGEEGVSVPYRKEQKDRGGSPGRTMSDM